MQEMTAAMTTRSMRRRWSSSSNGSGSGSGRLREQARQLVWRLRSSSSSSSGMRSRGLVLLQLAQVVRLQAPAGNLAGAVVAANLRRVMTMWACCQQQVLQVLQEIQWLSAALDLAQAQQRSSSGDKAP